MPRPDRPLPRAVIFDLDEALLDRRRAWQYAVEEAVAGICGERVSAAGLLEEYRRRPAEHALAVLVAEPSARARCAERWRAIFYRSAMKRLLVHDGVGMGLDRLVQARIEVGAISREPHSVARKQVESTGLDRFVTVLSATPAGEGWQPGERIAECLAFLERPAGDCAFLGIDRLGLGEARNGGLRTFAARWAWQEGDCNERAIQSPGQLYEELARVWGDR
jgi:phosphoglycolate phosphatase-like HAD superfamily hydrolase